MQQACSPTAQLSHYLQPRLDGDGYADGVRVLGAQQGGHLGCILGSGVR